MMSFGLYLYIIKAAFIDFFFFGHLVQQKKLKTSIHIITLF